MDDNHGDEILAELRQQWRQDRSAPVMLHLADECRRQGRLPEAIAVLHEGVRRHPGRLAPRVALGRCHLEAGDTAAAAEILEAVVEQDPTQLVANKLLVEAWLGRGELEMARRRLELYETLNPGDPDLEELRVRLAEAGRARGRAADEEASRSAVAGSPGTGPDAARTIAAFPGRPASDWREDDEVVPLLPAEPSAAARVGDLFPGFDTGGGADYWASITSGPFGAAIAPPAAAPAAAPTATLGGLYLQQGHAAEAARIFRQVLERSPDHRVAQDGMTAAAKGGRRAQALDLLRSHGAEPETVAEASRQDVLRAYLQVVLGRT